MRIYLTPTHVTSQGLPIQQYLFFTLRISTIVLDIGLLISSALFIKFDSKSKETAFRITITLLLVTSSKLHTIYQVTIALTLNFLRGY